jgi:mannose-6-phosphate isomerase-like protein (cupin superfamily)
MNKVNLAEKFARIGKPFCPKIVGELNGQEVRLAKVRGEFIWHRHEHEDELFLVVRGRLTIRLRTGDVELNEGELFIVPRGVEHQPFAAEEAWVVLFEPASTLNTGDVRNERTVEELEHL